MKCPLCASAEVKRLRPAFGDDNMLNPRNFGIRHDLQCQTCGAAWRPPCSLAGAVSCILSGAFLLAALLAIAVFFL